MAKKGQKFRKYSDGFKAYIVSLRLEDRYSLRYICRLYSLNTENVIKWTRRYLSGEPLTMKRGRKSKKTSSSSKSKPLTPEKELEMLRTELAFKNKLIEHLQERERLKKKDSLKSSKN